MKKPIKIKTEDGYSFFLLSAFCFLLSDGRYADSLVEENIDMSWNSLEEMVTTFHAEQIDYYIYFN
jgi:uncharacterized membrane protein YbaN (DUF454 family)